MVSQAISELFDLTGKSAVVTGGAMGIGKGVVSRLTEAGSSVMLTDIDMDAANQTAEEIRAAGGKVEVIHADAASVTDAKKVAKATVDAFGSLDILVNNAGIFFASPFLSMTEESWDNLVNINLKGVFFYSQAAAQVMVDAKRGGKIINVCSTDSLKPTGLVAHYNAAKGGVLMLTKAMALELGPKNILVNAVAPGGITTPGVAKMGQSLAQVSLGQMEIADYLKGHPLGRFGKPDDVAKVVLFLASRASDYMCGEMIVVDGGHLLR